MSDTIFIDALQVYTTIATDCWDRPRPQLVLITLSVDLNAGFLDKPGESDNVHATLNYSSLATSLLGRIEKESGFDSVKHLALSLATEAFALAGQAATHVHLALVLSKYILLADSFTVYLTAERDASGVVLGSCKVSIDGIIIPAIIGIHPHEIATKQRVIVDLTFFEHVQVEEEPDYRIIISALARTIESSSHLTLESFVLSTVREACMASAAFESVTVCTKKPSALTYAQASGVQITRKRSVFACK